MPSSISRTTVSTTSTRAHRFDYHDYSTGFRCCVDAASDRVR